MAKKRFQEAGLIIRKAAKLNRKPLSNEFNQAFELKSEKDLEMHAPKTISSEDESNTDSKQIWATLKQFISSRRIIVRFLIMFFIWYNIFYIFLPTFRGIKFSLISGQPVHSFISAYHLIRQASAATSI